MVDFFSVMGWFANGLFVVAVLYLLFTIKEFYQVFYPNPCSLSAETSHKCFLPAVPSDSVVNIKVVAVDAKNGVKYEEVLLEKAQHKYNEPFTENLNLTVTEKLKNNGTLRAMIYIVPEKRYSWFATKRSTHLTKFYPELSLAINLMGSQNEGNNTTDIGLVERLWTWLSEPSIFQKDFATFSKDFISRLSVGIIQLRDGLFSIPADVYRWLTEEQKGEPVLEKPKNQSVKIVSQMRHELSVAVMSDDFLFGPENIPPVVGKLFELKNNKYLPLWFADNLSLRAKQMQPIKGEVGSKMTVAFNYNPIGVGKFNMLLTMEDSIANMKNFGFNDNDLDDVKGLFSGTNFFLLILTVFVSVFHLLFDFLAFKSDIAFWRKKKDMVGLSMTTVVWRFVSTFIIMLYLFDENTSKLVLYPMLISTAIEFWKLTKAFKVRIVWPSQSGSQNKLPKIVFGDEEANEKATNEFDNKALHYLTYLLIPLVIGGAIYSLVYVPHKSVYSWMIQSLVNGVYAFGFLFMLPQLFVNYKLKSVAHLPWKAFMYKAFNTFIDDVFAFIITMPTAHRLACFRDDVIFVIYLYQRYLYPVDKSRTNEFGQTFEDEGNSNQAGDGKTAKAAKGGKKTKTQ